jgi:hypothetical protein
MSGFTTDMCLMWTAIGGVLTVTAIADAGAAAMAMGEADRGDHVMRTCLVCSEKFRARAAEDICNSDDCAARDEAIRAVIIAAMKKHPEQTEKTENTQ